MRRILRITNEHALRSADPDDDTARLGDATHRYFFFSAYRVLEDGTWEEGRSCASIVSVRRLFALLYDAGLIREVTSPKQPGGEPDDAEQ